MSRENTLLPLASSRLLHWLCKRQRASGAVCFVQEVTVGGNGVAGAPMVLPFRVLFDRELGTGETDVVVTDQDFREITATVF